MDLVLADPKRVQKMLNQFGESTGMCYQLYRFSEQKFYFSQNIKALTGDSGTTVCSLQQWYDRIYEPDRRRIQKQTRFAIQKANGHYGVNYRLRNSSNQLIWVSSYGSCIFDKKHRPEYVLGTLTVWNDSEEHDPCSHRSAFIQILEEIYNQGQDGYLLVMGVDDLSQIKLKYGCEFGDTLLQNLICAMRSSAEDELQPFRISDTAFCVLLLGAERSDVESYFQNIRKRMGDQCIVAGGCVAVQEYQVPQISLLLNYAESALEIAKLEDKDRLHFFEPKDYERKLAIIELQQELEMAVKGDFQGFSLHYQAQVRSESFELAGAEALLRFTSPRRGEVAPGDFIPILERSNLIRPVGLWVLRSALAQCRIWRKIFPEFRVSVNMSYSQLRHPQIQADVFSALQEAGLPGSALAIEVTEGMELQEYTYLNTIFSAWEKEGISISVDDFGTGFSSLSWLKQLAIDEIKIDRCFISGIQHSAYNLRLLSNVISLANSSSLRVCCEGVEDAGELAVLETLGPTLYQGFLFARPVPPEDFPQNPQQWQSRIQALHLPVEIQQEPEEEIVCTSAQLEHAILRKTEDVISLCDINTYEIHYLNPAGQRVFGVRDYRGRKCYKTLYGKDSPCEFCHIRDLRHDSFYIWEDWNPYCDRHFLMKDKLLTLGGKTLRLQVATDITRREFISQRSRERLEFANRIAEYVDLLSQQQDWCHMVNLALEIMGKFYKADRAFLFEGNPKRNGSWDNTFEWCTPGVTPQIDNLQSVPPERVARWMEVFRSEGAVFIYNLDPLRNRHPAEWEILQKQGIQRVIAVPLMLDGEVAGFIGVDNPRYAIEDDSQARVIAGFLMARFRRERVDWQRKEQPCSKAVPAARAGGADSAE